MPISCSSGQKSVTRQTKKEKSNSKVEPHTHKAIYTGSPHIWLIWFSGTTHAEQSASTNLLSVTHCNIHLVLEVFVRQILLSGIVFPLTYVVEKLSQHSADT